MSQRATAPFTPTNNLDYPTLKDAIDTLGFIGALQNVARVSTLQSLSEARPYVTTASIYAAIQGRGPLEVVAGLLSPFNPYPFKRGAHASALDAARAGLIRKRPYSDLPNVRLGGYLARL